MRTHEGCRPAGSTQVRERSKVSRNMSKRSFRIALAIVLATLLTAGAVAAYVTNRALGYPDERRAGTGQEIEVTIESGMNFPAVAALLHERGVIDQPRAF